MNKKMKIRVWLIILSSIMTFTIAGCKPAIQIVTPTAPPLNVAPSITPVLQPSTADSPYIHYTPSKGYDIHLEFDYPGSWDFGEYKENSDNYIIGLGDPRFRSLPHPTFDPQNLTRTINDYGFIDIWISPREPGQTPDTELEGHKQPYMDDPMITLLGDYKIAIDGYDASVLEYLLNDIENYPSVMFVRRTFLIINEQSYEIYYTVAEKDRGGEFEQGYEYFLNSLRILP